MLSRNNKSDNNNHAKATKATHNVYINIRLLKALNHKYVCWPLDYFDTHVQQQQQHRLVMT